MQMMLLRFCLSWIAVAAFAVTAAGAQEVPAQRSQEFRVFSRAVVYERGTWTVAYVPEARSGADVATGRSYDLLRPDGRYELETEPTQSSYCFLVSHRYGEFAGEESYLGVAAYSFLMPRTNLVRPVSMFRNNGWRRGDDARFGNRNDFKSSMLRPHEFFRAHLDAPSLEELDTRLDHRWHGQYGDDDEQNSWNDHDVWALSNDINEDREDTRFDGKLIRFAFTRRGDSSAPPSFCLSGDRRLETMVTLFSPYMEGTLEFTIVFQ